MKTKCNKCGTITTRQNGIEDRMGGGPRKSSIALPTSQGLKEAPVILIQL